MANPRFSLPIPLALWGVSIFLSAFLLFEVQPILGKAILPWFGGTAGVWTASLMFFQITYLLGNLYAHWVVQGDNSRLKIRVHLALLVASLFLLPIAPRDFWKPVPGTDPTLRILGLLAVTVGLPFALLSATSPLLQTWYRHERKSGQPYRFYALSNAASLLALLSYPVVTEPLFGTRHQLEGWSFGYAAFVVLSGIIAFGRPAGPISSDRPPVVSRPDWKIQTLWVALAADASALLLAITTYISLNVAAIPLLWIFPLALYLLSMILCFEGRNWYRRTLFMRLAAVALTGMTLSPYLANAGPLLQIPFFCASLFICCMVCHGELAKLKPEPEQLTLFYLMVSLGGALGGVFVGVVAPYAFRGFYELPIAMAGCAILSWIVLHRDPSTVYYRARTQLPSLELTGLVALLIVSLFFFTKMQAQNAFLTVRNFYGVLRVHDRPATDFEPARRDLVNGTIVHGLEIMEKGRRDEPTTYYGPESGAGLALRAAHQRGSVRAGIIGLGTGTLASYGQAGDRITIYEINPLVIQIANSEFYFLRDSAAQVEITPGDARLSLESRPPQGFDVLAVDAFSGDAIPLHLLTIQAFRLYFSELTSQGILAVHVSNRYLDLVPVVDAAAKDLGAFSKVIDNEPDKAKEVVTSVWVLLAKNRQDLDGVGVQSSKFGQGHRDLRPWTDDWSNLLRVFK